MIVYEVYDKNRAWKDDHVDYTADSDYRSIIYQTNDEFPVYLMTNSPSNSYRMF